MREIKFRGKAKMRIEELDEMHFKHDNSWFIGNLIANGSTPYIVGNLVETDPEYVIHEFWVSVHPESIGQYTGLKDKDGKEIYEGDIIDWNIYYDRPSEIGVVEYLDGSFGIGIWHLCEDLRNGAEGNIQLKTAKVIGNIFEHPHMLKNKDKM